MTIAKANMKLWDSVCTTDPTHTKKVNQRGGFIAIDAMYQIQEATRAFGPAGVGWGWDFELSFPPNDTILAKVTLWHGKQGQTVTQVGQKRLNQKNGADEDAAKKAVTDGLTKCLSYLGFNADVFLGKFDDNKYVQGLLDDKPEQAKPHWANDENPPPPEAWANEAIKTIDKISSMDALGEWWAENQSNIAALPANVQAEVKQAKNVKKNLLSSNAA